MPAFAALGSPVSVVDLLARSTDTNAEDWAGLHINIQLFTLPHQEEKALAIADVVDRLIKGV